MRTHWLALHTSGNSVAYFDALGVEETQKKSRDLLTTTIS